MHNMKHSRAVSSNNLSERRLIFRARKARQLEVRRFFVTVRQKRSSTGFGEEVWSAAFRRSVTMFAA